MHIDDFVIVVMVFALSLAGCGDGGGDSGSETPGGQEGTLDGSSIDDGGAASDAIEGGSSDSVDLADGEGEEDIVVLPPDPTFTNVTAFVFKAKCADCHTTEDQDEQGELDFETDDIYSQLIDVQAVEAPNKTRVIPFDPDNSFLVQKLEGDQKWGEGDVMPPPPSSSLNPDLIQLVRDWITAGALDD